MDTSLFTKEGRYLMLALDHRGSFRKMINPENPEAVSDQEMIAWKVRIIEPLVDLVSGILIDPAYGLPALRLSFKKLGIPQGRVPYVLSIEESGYQEKEGERYSKLQYNASQLREGGASAIKLLLYFDPEGKSAQHQMDIAKEALKQARQEHLPLFLEIITYGKERKSAGVGEATLGAMRMLLARGVRADVWKLEFPGSSKFCQQISELAGAKPWILLTRGASFEKFKRELEISMENGAAGFLAGRALWQEAMAYRDQEQEQFLTQTLPRRFAAISEIPPKSIT